MLSHHLPSAAHPYRQMHTATCPKLPSLSSRHVAVCTCDILCVTTRPSAPLSAGPPSSQQPPPHPPPLIAPSRVRYEAPPATWVGASMARRRVRAGSRPTWPWCELYQADWIASRKKTVPYPSARPQIRYVCQGSRPPDLCHPRALLLPYDI